MLRWRELGRFPEAGYCTSNNLPQGELCIRCPVVTEEYYDMCQLYSVSRRIITSALNSGCKMI